MRDAKKVSQLLSYDPETGVFRWLADRKPGIKAGTEAGSFDAYGYRRIKVEGLVYLSHRLAWLMTYGVWPPEQIDHKNGDRADNRISNLRMATNSENRQNTRRADRDNATGFLGVTKSRKRFGALIRIDGKSHWIGTFDDPALAHAAYLEAKVRLHPFQTIGETK